MDEELVEAAIRQDRALLRWYVASGSAVVLGLAQRIHRAALLDRQRLEGSGVAVLERRAGGGMVLLDGGMLGLAVALPAAHPLVLDDLTASYHWLGEALRRGLQALGVAGARLVEVAEARQDVAERRTAGEHLLLQVCYGTLSPHEVVVGTRKLAGLAQVRRAQGVLFQAGILLRDQSALANYVRVPDEAARGALSESLRLRGVGLMELVDPGTASQAASAIEPFVLARLHE